MNIDNLPALKIELTGTVTSNNLPEFRDAALAVIDAVNTDLQTDDDFAAAEDAIKWARQVEDRLDDAKAVALSQTASIDELFRAIDEIREHARTKRLELTKMVKTRKEMVRDQIAAAAQKSFAEHVERLDGRLSPLRVPGINVNFVEAMKGKKTVRSLQDAADQELMRAKIESNDLADRIEANVKTLNAIAGDYRHLFADLQQIAVHPADHFEALVKSRVSEYRESERKRLEAEQARIRAEEEAKARREADARVEAEREAIRREERRKAEEEAKAEQAVEAERPQNHSLPVSDYTVRLVVDVEMEWDTYEMREEILAGDLDLHSSEAVGSVGRVRVLEWR